jgi:hypothetical protein
MFSKGQTSFSRRGSCLAESKPCLAGRTSCLADAAGCLATLEPQGFAPFSPEILQKMKSFLLAQLQNKIYIASVKLKTEKKWQT